VNVTAYGHLKLPAAMGHRDSSDNP